MRPILDEAGTVPDATLDHALRGLCPIIDNVEDLGNGTYLSSESRESLLDILVAPWGLEVYLGVYSTGIRYLYRRIYPLEFILPWLTVAYITVEAGEVKGSPDWVHTRNPAAGWAWPWCCVPEFMWLRRTHA